MKFLFSLIACFLSSLAADVKVLSLGELGSIRYISDDQHLLQIERLSPLDDVIYIVI